MQVNDMRRVEPGTAFDVDIAVIGTGPAGLSFARQFFGTNVGIVLLEAGGLQEADEPAPSETFECSGAPRFTSPRRVRNKVFGGSSHSWAGKCRTFDEIDFEQRHWVPYSGWPVSLAEMMPYCDRAAQTMHLGPNIYDEQLVALLNGQRSGIFKPAILRSSCWQFARDPERRFDFLRFGPEFLRQSAPNLQVFTNAAVTDIETSESGQVEAVEVSSGMGRTVKFFPKIVILAGGAIENARLLLASNRRVATGVANQYDLVGRFLMDHPRAAIGEYRSEEARQIQAALGLFQLKQGRRSHIYTHGVVLSPDLQKQKGLLNCAAYLSEHRAHDDPWDALKRLVARQSQNFKVDALNVVSSPGVLLKGLHQRFVARRGLTHKIDRLVIDSLVEQVPDPTSRITLSDRKDEVGMPLAHLHWKISDLERQSVAELAHAFAGETSRLGLKSPTPPAWLEEGDLGAIPFTDMAHPTGTTRMAISPKNGVVDQNCHAHGARGLYLAGSSVFPTASHANPTLMIVAMAIRLADYVKAKHFS